MDQPIISILITYYNEGELIGECLESIIPNSASCLEVLIYDDGSLNPAEKYIPAHLKSAVKIFRSETNNGPGYGRTKLLQLASGLYVHFHDSDDLFAPGWLSKVQSAINLSKADVILTGIKSINENGDTLSEDVMEINSLGSEADLVLMGLSGSVLVPSTTFLRQLGLQVGGYENRDILPQSEDFHFHLKLGLLKPSIFMIPEPLIIQRIRKSSHSHTSGLLVCYQSALTALFLLEKNFLSSYKPDLASAFARLGHKLYVLSDLKNARIAFRKAKELGGSDFSDRNNRFKFIACFLGQEIAEFLSFWVQKLKKYPAS